MQQLLQVAQGGGARRWNSTKTCPKLRFLDVEEACLGLGHYIHTPAYSYVDVNMEIADFLTALNWMCFFVRAHSYYLRAINKLILAGGLAWS